ncbi:MAG TPA: hypothetical protein VMM38_00905 [Aridibacter sp.]|nr:hypothetical protein [Aridibacter sp.]
MRLEIMSKYRKRIFHILFLLTISLCLISPGSVVAQPGESEIEAYRAQSVEVNRLVSEGELKRAQRKAADLIDTAGKLFGREDRETGIAAKNAGEISRAREDYSDAIEYLSDALEIFQKADQNGSNAGMIAKTASSLGFALARKEKEEDAAGMYELAYRKGVEAFGENSADMIPIMRGYAFYKVFVKDFEGADEQFAKLYTLTKTFYPGDDAKLQALDDEYSCTVGINVPFALAGGPTRYSEAKTGLVADSAAEGKIVDRGVINGAAIRLAKPNPSSAALRAIPGGSRVVVRLVIGIKGNVTKAEAICGPKVLWAASEEAALRSRFKPTMLKGEAVEVSGVIVYNYF